MRAYNRQMATALLGLAMLPLAGCRFTTRKLPKPLAPEVVETVAPQKLVDQMNERW